jgi:hypothetical protein
MDFHRLAIRKVHKRCEQKYTSQGELSSVEIKGLAMAREH